MSAARKPHRERATLSLDETERLWALVAVLDEAESPLAMSLYIFTAEYQGDSTWLVPSKTDLEVKYEVCLDRDYCSCPHATHSHGCSHLRAMRFRSKLQFSKPE